MSAIVGLSTDILKYVNEDSRDTIIALMERLDPVFTKGFLKELKATIDSNTRVLLLEGANPQINLDFSLSSALTHLALMKDYYVETPYVRDIESIERSIGKLIEYVNTYVHLSIPGNSQEEVDTILLQDMKRSAKVEKAINAYYITPLSRVYNFAKQAKKSTKFPNPDSDTIKHGLVIPEDLSDLVDEKDLGLKYLTVIASLCDIDSKNSYTDLLHMFMHIDRLTTTALSPFAERLGIDIGAVNLEYLKITMYSNLLMSAFRAHSQLYGDRVDILELDTNHFLTKQCPHSGYNLEYFRMYDTDILESADHEVVKALQKFWRAHCHYHRLMFKQTSIVGFTHEYHWGLKFDRAIRAKIDRTTGQPVLNAEGKPIGEAYDIPFDLGYKLNELIMFSMKIMIDAQSSHISLPRSGECEDILNTIIGILSKEQYTEKEVYDYTKTYIKPSDYLIANIRSDVMVIQQSVNSLVAKLVKENLMYDVAHDGFTQIIQHLDTVKFCTETEDSNMIPDYYEDWACVNHYLGDSLIHISDERRMLLYCYEQFTKCYNAIRFKNDIFVDGIVEKLNKTKTEQITLGTASNKSGDGSGEIYCLDTTYQFNQDWKHKIYNDTFILQQRVKYITEYENAYSSADSNFNTIKSDYRKFIDRATGYVQDTSTIVNDAITLHYGHTSVNSSFLAYKSRENRLEPTKIEQSRSKHVIESTIESHQQLYQKLESREFMLERLASPKMMVEAVW